MCDLAYDLASEEGTVTYDTALGSSPTTITCSAGRVIVAASVWQNWPYNHFPAAVALGDGSGELIDTVKVYSSGDTGGISSPTFTYQLTTAKISSLS